MSSPASPVAAVHIQWGVRIPMRDGIHLSGTLYLPNRQPTAAPAILTLTPYTGNTFHERGLYCATHGYPFLTVDVRGRGNSDGHFKPFIHDGRDGYDVVEWLAQQPYCNGQVAMYGTSYQGYTQWATAAQFPPHLATIVPVASPYIGVDFPIRNNIAPCYLMQWLTAVWGRTSQEKILYDTAFFWSKFGQWARSGRAFDELDRFLGNPSPIFQEWLSHPHQDDYWDSYNPTAQDYARLSIPILTITGSYDDDQPGALTHYRAHLKHAPSEQQARHYLVIGPWDHAGTALPKTQFGGLEVGPASLVDLQKLRLEWYAWTLQDGPKPQFLQKNVAYYLMGAEEWRYADTLEQVTSHHETLFLRSGALDPEPSPESQPDEYLYDPRDTSHALLESTIDPDSLTDHRMIQAAVGQQLEYHGAPFGSDREIAGFFKLSIWLSIDQLDTDFRVRIYEIRPDDSGVLLSADWMRARFRESPRNERLIPTTDALRYDFQHFTFIARHIRKGNRLRLVIGPLNSIYSQKNYNSGRPVAQESMQDAHPVVVKLFHGPDYPSVLHVPFGQESSS